MPTALKKEIRLRERPLFIISFLIVIILVLLKLTTLPAYQQAAPLMHLAKPQQHHQWYFNVYVNFPAQAYGLFFLSLFWGWLNGIRDNVGRFYNFLTTQGYSRKTIFKTLWWERAWPVLTFGLIYWGSLTTIWILSLSWSTLKMTLLQLLLIIFTNLLINQAAWIMMTLVSLFFSNIIFSLLALAAFWWTAGQTIYYLDHPHFDLWNNFLYPMTDLRFWPLFGIYLGLIVFGTLISYWLFQHYSGENIGEFFSVPQTRWLFSILMMILVATVFYLMPVVSSTFIVILLFIVITVTNFWSTIQRRILPYLKFHSKTHFNRSV
ncbi:hypothetical protein [Lapidilactobacillus wuchangensis]|uniref:hypothetical protein n=1 Tax=Lapidilactobacillus wuchangensis TaxID=2486001 RepID=UPI000F76CA2A|nr:hypothetical protein [Lapidilactobacillus wuchangensis]